MEYRPYFRGCILCYAVLLFNTLNIIFTNPVEERLWDKKLLG